MGDDRLGKEGLELRIYRLMFECCALFVHSLFTSHCKGRAACSKVPLHMGDHVCPLDCSGNAHITW